MILTDYYRFERLATKAKSRMDCTASTMTYEEFEEKRATKATKATEHRDATNVGDLIIYYNDTPTQFGGNVHRKADKSITIKSKNLSSVYVPDVNRDFAYGDFTGTNDALLFVFYNLEVKNGEIQEGAIIEVFVARGKSRDRVPLYNALCDGELDEEMNALREQVTKTVTEPEKP